MPRNLDDRTGRNAPERDLSERTRGTQEIDSLASRQQDLANVQASQPEGFMDKLTDPMNLIKLGLATAGGLSGNEDLQGLAAGLGMGTLESPS